MKRNTGKCYFLISGNRSEYMWAKLDQDVVWESNDAELLGVTIDKFESVNFTKFLRIPFLENTSGRLLLKFA